MATPLKKVESETERQRAEHYKRKQEWKNLPGNRYTPEELQRMAKELGPFNLVEEDPDEMRLK